ncbi:MAG TPA: exodeoxyribonuclease VII small subunit [Alphaproteobacteria bacterium]|nr:exodeoxyribonuclease VII small subunit [Alphaproteobacteria bacterium]
MSNEKSFEELMAQLETMVRRLESGDVPLEEGLQAYGEGMKLVEAAKKLLQGYEMRVEKIVSAQGDVEPFEE